jgi:hypothetical protein
MEAIEAVKQAAAAAGVPVTHIGRAMGKRDNYVSATARRGSSPQANTLAAMLAPCGYVLAAMPRDDAPASALIIDPPARD